MTITQRQAPWMDEIELFDVFDTMSMHALSGTKVRAERRREIEALRDAIKNTWAVHKDKICASEDRVATWITLTNEWMAETKRAVESLNDEFKEFRFTARDYGLPTQAMR